MTKEEKKALAMSAWMASMQQCQIALGGNQPLEFEAWWESENTKK